MTEETEEKIEHSDFETIRRAFAVFNGFEGPSNDNLWWRTDAEYAPITLLVHCNDLFAWGCSDCEPLGPSNIAALEQAYTDAKAAGDLCHADLLWVARQRGMRPQGAYYKYFKKGMWSLFDACGPEREVGLGNPYAPGGDIEKKASGTE